MSLLCLWELIKLEPNQIPKLQFLIYRTGISIFPLPSVKTPLPPFAKGGSTARDFQDFFCERGERVEHLYLKQKTGNDFPPFAKGD